MRPCRFVACLLVLVATLARGDDVDGLELWLASGPKCNSCDVYSEVATHRGYGDHLHYRLGSQSLDIPIKRVEKSTLEPAILSQLQDGSRPHDEYWPLQLTVLVVRGSKVLYSDNIAASADIRTALLPDERMKPPARPPKSHPALRKEHDYRGFFVANWNLEYFIDVALGQTTRHSFGHFIELDRTATPDLGTTNVVFLGAGGTPIGNALFISERMTSIRKILERELPASHTKFITLYGRGPNGDSNDTSMMRKGNVVFTHPSMSIDYAADIEGLSTVFSALRRVSGDHTLLVHVGHSGPTGIPIWGSLGTLSPENLAAIGDAQQSKLTMISGGCHSGLFARAVQCGFFAAHPQVIASGCQLSPEAIRRSDDYLKLLFASLSDHLRGPVTFEQAHWRASTRLETHQLSYTTLDALADAHFERSPISLPREMSVADIRALKSAATPSEAGALTELTSGLHPTLPVTLTDIVELNHAADTKLTGMTEASSAKRNRQLNLPYRLMLPSLARRLIYRSTHQTDPELLSVTACERRSLSQL